MAQVQRTLWVPYSPEQMYALVVDVESYPKFVPWCRAARIEQRDDAQVVASLTFAKAGVEHSFTTRNRQTPPQRVELTLVEGPFRFLQGEWRFTPQANGCTVGLTVSFEFSGFMLRRVFGPVFELVLESLTQAFFARARSVYGAA